MVNTGRIADTYSKRVISEPFWRGGGENIERYYNKITKWLPGSYGGNTEGKEKFWPKLCIVFLMKSSAININPPKDSISIANKLIY